MLPEAATHKDLPGQKAFIEHWFDLYNYGYATGNTAPVLAVSNGETPDMKSMISDVQEIHSRGGTVTGGQYEITDSVEVELNTNNGATPTIVIRQHKGTVEYPDGTLEEIPELPPTAYGMVLSWQGDHWYMFGIGTL